jgi:hypothetical protein
VTRPDHERRPGRVPDLPVRDRLRLPPADAQLVLSTALAVIDWAAAYRQKAQDEGPTEGAAGERWEWYCQGSFAAAKHDRDCVESELRRLLSLPETDR